VSFCLRGADIFYGPRKTCFIPNDSGHRRCLAPVSEIWRSDREFSAADVRHASSPYNETELTESIPSLSAVRNLRMFLAGASEPASGG
jgi:hypothetical protein